MSRLHCIDSNEGGLDYEKSNPNTFSEFYKPKSRYEGVEKSPNGPFEFNQKRSSSEDFDEKSQSSSVQKRQVGVVYKDETPIGILQVNFEFFFANIIISFDIFAAVSTFL